VNRPETEERQKYEEVAVKKRFGPSDIGKENVSTECNIPASKIEIA